MLPEFQRLFTQFMSQSWQTINDQLLAGRLTMPVFAISPGKSRLGSWNREQRTLSLAEHLLLNHSREECLDVLKHEMAHQYADEILDAGAVGETAHGTAFRRGCEILGIQHHARFRATGEPSPILRRVQKLLALSESHNLHEAEAAMAKARELIEKYEVDLGWRDFNFGYLHVGLPRKRKSLVDQLIAGILVRFFHIAAVWIPTRAVTGEQRLWLLELNGEPANLEIAEYVHDFLLGEIALLWRDLQRRSPYHKGKSAKRDFQVGVLKGLSNKMAAGEAPSAADRELILVKRERLRQFTRERHKHLRKGARSSYRESDAYYQGYAKGQHLDIRKGVTTGDRLPKRLEAPKIDR